MKKVLITGADGFVGKNLQLLLGERKDVEILRFTRKNSPTELEALIEQVDFVFHLAGVNRPTDPGEFSTGNVDLTLALCNAAKAVANTTGKRVPILYSSSIQAALENAYGQSKRGAEEALVGLTRSHQIPTYIFRLPNVFGKWCRPNYNSAVATFCHNIARGLPIQINDPLAQIKLVYVDDVIAQFVQVMDGANTARTEDGLPAVTPEYTITVGELAEQIAAFKESRTNLITERVGTGWLRALYSTYVSYLPVEEFAYSVPRHGDARGVFVEMLKTQDSGQFSFFTAHPGITRGGHYHHSKTEKFLVIKGLARFRFKNMQSGECYELATSGEEPQIVETVPGWTHDVTNIGTDELVVMLWANEIFDRARPDTFFAPL